MIINLSKKSKKPIFLIRNLEIIVTSFVNFACADFAQHQQSFSQSSKLIGIVLCCQYISEWKICIVLAMQKNKIKV